MEALTESLLILNHIKLVRSFLIDQYKLFKSGYQMNLDASMLHVKFKKDHLNDALVNTYQFNHVDEAKTTQSLSVRTQKMSKNVENTVAK